MNDEYRRERRSRACHTFDSAEGTRLQEGRADGALNREAVHRKELAERRECRDPQVSNRRTSFTEAGIPSPEYRLGADLGEERLQAERQEEAIQQARHVR